ncbi:hypothetical protein G8C92_13100 [Paenibacillus donghaensis]|uniref:hypothetical protein n=1 Tax=Paenibacillus donghaensis TaxID=414771 RepID=UPI0018836E8F|nr:hypothetical protein [Paenibacillus donghaensis]MBE9914974.1 hypothetical protein [Paenibacillus donghaensis]
MKPNVGDVYCVYIEKLRRYTACQITGIKAEGKSKSHDLVALLELDWTGEELPREDELGKMQPLYGDFFFWDKNLELSYVGGNVPKNYIKVGNIPPIIDGKTNSYGTWNVGDSIYRQLRWEAIPEERRKAFKEAANDNSMVEVGGRSLQRSTHFIDDEVLQGLDDWSELDKLPCLTRIIAKKPYDSLLSFVNRNPFINELQWENHGCRVIDVKSSNLERIMLQVESLEELHLNPNAGQLSLYGSDSAGLTIYAYEGGRWMTANFSEGKPFGRGLERLGALHLNGIQELDMRQIVQCYPALNELRLWGKPGMVTNMESLAQLVGLKYFSTFDLFGFTGEQFPEPDQFPQLTWLWLTSLPADTAKAVKEKYKKEIGKGLDLSITKPRKPEWLRENLLNPFRDWDGREHITAANAKKAADVYKKTIAAIHSVVKQTQGGAADIERLKQELRSIVLNYTEAFNKMDQRTGFIETVEREEIYMVLADLLQTAKQQLESAGVNIDDEVLFRPFHELREF